MISPDRIFITCPRGLEEVTADQIKSITGNKVYPTPGGVSLSCDIVDIYKLNYALRTATYVLQEIISFRAANIFDLYSKIKDYNWSNFIDSSDTISIRARVKSKHYKNSNFLSLRVKDAIVDRLKLDTGSRPSINKDNPTYSFFVNVRDDKVKIYLNTSGAPLYKRNYRGKVHRASLNPTIAAGIILLSNWDSKESFYDPMCGSGTIPIEALMIAASIPSGLLRSEYAFQKWNSYNDSTFQEIKNNYISKINRSLKTKIYGSDNTEKNMLMVENSLERLGMEKKITLQVRDILDFNVYGESGTIIMNPPHGLRMSSEGSLKNLYNNIGNVLKNKCHNHDTYIFCMNNSLSKSVGLRTKRRYQLQNGKIDCRLLYYPISDGKYA